MLTGLAPPPVSGPHTSLWVSWALWDVEQDPWSPPTRCQCSTLPPMVMTHNVPGGKPAWAGNHWAGGRLDRVLGLSLNRYQPVGSDKRGFLTYEFICVKSLKM